MARTDWWIVCLLGGTLATPAAAAEPIDPAPVYAEFREPRIDPATALWVEDLELVRGGATIRFERGVLVPVVAGERTIGFTFDGRGTFAFEPPDPLERAQLARFAGAPRLDDRFDRAVAIFSDTTATALGDRPAAVGGERAATRALDYWRERTVHRRDKLGANLAARLLHDSLDGPGGFFLFEPRTKRHSVLTFVVDPSDDEQIQLYHWTPRFGGMLDTWCSYGAGPAPGRNARAAHYQLAVRLDGGKPLEVTASVVLEPVADRPPPRVLSFALHPLMEVTAVTGATGEPVFFAREPTRDEEFEPHVTIVLPQPVSAGTRVSFRAEGEVIEDLRAGIYGIKTADGWYPRLGAMTRATYDLTFDLDSRRRVFASGRAVAERVADGRRVSEWQQTFPVASVSFNFGEMDVEEVALDGLPPVTVFGKERGIVPGNALQEVGADVARSLGYFGSRFGPYPFERMYATRIPYGHGQGFPGLLHLASETFGGGIRGLDQSFRAHEVAHQWWGHLVGWKSYRDQWLSEGFSVYSGALYARWSLDDPEVLTAMLASWRNDLLGSGNLANSLGFGHYGFSREMMKWSDGAEAGPISLGRRLRSSLGPLDYDLLVYEKGAWVLHMLRMLLHDFLTGSDQRFDDLMRDFVRSHRFDDASTADFQRVVEAHCGEPMAWFFAQWVHGTQIPEYRHGWRAERRAGVDVVRLRVRQRLAEGESFRMSVPFRVALADGTSRVERIEVAGPSTEIVLELPAAAVGVEFNIDDAVLCTSRAEPM